MRIGRFNLRTLAATLAPHPSPLPRERGPVTLMVSHHQPSPEGEGARNDPGGPVKFSRTLAVALAPHPSPLPGERGPVTIPAGRTTSERLSGVLSRIRRSSGREQVPSRPRPWY